MMRIRVPLSVGLALLLACLVVAQPLSVGAADCSGEKAAIDQLSRDISRLEDDLAKQMRDRDAAERDMASDLQLISKLEQTLAAEAPLVSQELTNKGLSSALMTLAVQVAETIAIGFAGPEGLGLLGHSLVTVLELAEKAQTATELYELFRGSAEAATMMDELTAELGNLDAAQAFADENGLTQMSLMLEHEANLTAAMKSFDQDWSRFRFAVNAIAGDTALLKTLGIQLAADWTAFYACQDQAGPVPSACEGQATNPNGAGVCR